MYIYIYIYIYSLSVDDNIRSPIGVEHSGEGVVGRRSHNAKLFEYLIRYKNVNKWTLLLLLHRYLKNSLSQRSLLVGRVV